MTGTANIIRANSRDLPLADDTVDLVVTSPPYFALRSYQDGGEHYEGQIGDEPTPAEFVESLLEVTRECVRVLKPSGSLWVNLGDKYAGNGGGGVGSSDGTTGRGPRPARFNVGIPTKSLIGIPWRYALRCIDDLGLILRAEVIWAKPNGLPESVTDRVRRSHEQWFHFTLSPRYFSAVDEIREEHKPGQSPAALSFAREGRETAPGQTAAPHRVGREAQGLNPLGKLPGSVWTVPTQPLRVPDHLGVDHFAAFPMEWPRRIIQGWAPTRGVCVECGEGRRPVVASVGLDMSRPQARRAHELAEQGGLTEAHFKALLSVGVSDTGRGAATQSGTGKNTPEVYALADKAREVLGGYAREYLLRRPTSFVDGCACPEPTAPTRPAVILDPFGGTGTTALLAKALGCHGISVDMSADYCRLAQWRTNDEAELARALQVEKPKPQVEGQASLLDLIDQEAIA